ncbi:sigma-70 family RNA polymerase sigma factor [Aeoliella mucimassa]|uniref:RNA polymerase sigma factor CnrH n=1 Tax=Aeoliella mucimassa TaxID=2527972 RepID=A0A518AS96_9BACT|nr:sigma-70 family RNA polymerase sigma factor [Aeoliella mucimassa]QDU57601.1 RNA polymerase sigma factor CnrH [Aeoliella mucimassa]
MAVDDRNPSERRLDFATQWAESYDRIRAYVRIFVPAWHDAEDVIQETAVAIAKDYEKYDPERPFLEWAVGIARNRVYEYYRRCGRDRRMLFDVETVYKIESTLVELETQVDDYLESLEHCLDSLPKRSHSMLELRYKQSLSTGEIANRLKMTINSVYSRLSQIRMALRNCIHRRLQKTEEPTT